MAVNYFVFKIHTSGKDLSGYFIFSKRRMEQEPRLIFHSLLTQLAADCEAAGLISVGKDQICLSF